MEKNESVDDPAAIGEALIVAAEKTKRPNFMDAVERLYQYLKCKAPRNQCWADASLYNIPWS